MKSLNSSLKIIMVAFCKCFEAALQSTQAETTLVVCLSLSDSAASHQSPVPGTDVCDLKHSLAAFVFYGQMLVHGRKGGVKHPYGLTHSQHGNTFHFYWTEYSDGHVRHLQLTQDQLAAGSCPARISATQIGTLRVESIPLFELRLYANNSQQGEAVAPKSNLSSLLAAQKPFENI